MENNTSCFVIIGYGKKPSYANGKLRLLDLDETYSLLIKPVFDAMGMPCYRAIDKNLSGSIDKLMLQEIKNAEISVVDISTLNANVMWELGVRHALKKKHTIMICEKEQLSSIPFDIGHFVVLQYAHSEEGIPYKEVTRFHKVLTDVVNGLLNQPEDGNDSPVFTFLEDELRREAEAASKQHLHPEEIPQESFADLMSKAEHAKDQKNYPLALELWTAAKEHATANMTLKDNLPFIICRQVLCTYKSQVPNELESLVSAKIILDELNPQQSQDTEVLGLSGAIHKRLYELNGDITYLDKAILFYEKGFQLKQDYYNGINTVFMLYKKVALLKTTGKEWEDAKLKADYLRNSVLEISLQLETEPDFLKTKNAVWVLLTIAEAFNYKGNLEKMTAYENKATILAAEKKDSFAISSYQEQKNKIEEIKNNL